ncbi:MAG TPA: sigma-70 family RNA polymerase sigma factor [Ohtaekwangia sp.]|nr:sigma-70 family RNA polymerase sigma factor [Ohtaekwangia sp.]
MPETPNIRPAIDNLFRHEAGKMVSLLTRIFGAHNLELAEDVVQDTLVKALEYWKIRGIPDNPSAWMLTVARNKVLDVLRRERHHKEFARDTSVLLKSEYSAGATVDHLFRQHPIEDEQLRMMFVCCHPGIPGEGQVALILKTLCGFSVAEIARAFVTNQENITKRLFRAREYFRQHQVPFELPAVEALDDRLARVIEAIYFLFNEGYNATHHIHLIRDDMVEEALRLGNLLLGHEATRRPETFALLSLMCLQASRLYGRIDSDGNLLLLRDQDRSQWNAELIDKGRGFLNQASQGTQTSKYHFEAAIAFEHCIAKTYGDTNWKRILQLYDWLLQLQPNGVVQLNRLIAYAALHGIAAALPAMEKLKDDPALKHYYLLYATLGDWHAQRKDNATAADYLRQASMLAAAPAEKKFLEGRIATLMI